MLQLSKQGQILWAQIRNIELLEKKRKLDCEVPHWYGITINAWVCFWILLLFLSEIVLGRRRITPEALEEAILAMDETRLTADFLSVCNVTVDISTYIHSYYPIQKKRTLGVLLLKGSH